MKKLALFTLLAGCAHGEVRGLDTVEIFIVDGVHLSERIVRYVVLGDSLHAVRSDMQRIGPIDDGRHQFAHTWANFAWSYPFTQSEGRCTTGPVKVEMEVVQTFPQWLDSKRQPKRIAAEWERWLRATVEHEASHRQIALLTARAMVAELPKVEGDADCNVVAQRANDRGNELLADMRRQHAELDKNTEHGAKTGAVLHDAP